MQEFKPTWLYVKSCDHCGLRYFGKTVKADPVAYKGSGVEWRQHLKKYAASHTTDWKRLFKKSEVCKRFAIKFSIDNDIIASKLWANLCIENGVDVGSRGMVMTIEQRERVSLAHIGNRHTKEAKEKISRNNAARRPEVAAKISASNKGQTRTEEQRRLMSLCHPRGMLGKQTTDLAKKRISAALTGRVFSDEHKANISAAKRGKISPAHLAALRRPRKAYTCPHCGLEGRGSNMKRYHFDNCSVIPD